MHFVYILRGEANPLRRRWRVRHEAALKRIRRANLLSDLTALNPLWRFGLRVRIKPA